MHEECFTPAPPNRWKAAVGATLVLLFMLGGFAVLFLWPEVLGYIVIALGVVFVIACLVNFWIFLYNLFL